MDTKQRDKKNKIYAQHKVIKPPRLKFNKLLQLKNTACDSGCVIFQGGLIRNPKIMKNDMKGGRPFILRSEQGDIHKYSICKLQFSIPAAPD